MIINDPNRDDRHQPVLPFFIAHHFYSWRERRRRKSAEKERESSKRKRKKKRKRKCEEKKRFMVANSGEYSGEEILRNALEVAKKQRIKYCIRKIKLFLSSLFLPLNVFFMNYHFFQQNF